MVALNLHVEVLGKLLTRLVVNSWRHRVDNIDSNCDCFINIAFYVFDDQASCDEDDVRRAVHKDQSTDGFAM